MPAQLNFPPLPLGVKERFDRILSGKQPMGLNEKGPAVTVVQQALVALGYKVVGTPDGSFGPKTQSGVKALQAANPKIVTQPNGIVGPATLGIIFASPLSLPGLTRLVDYVIYFEGNEPSITLFEDDVIDLSGLTAGYNEKRGVVRLGLRTTQLNSPLVTASFDAAAKAMKFSKDSGNLGRIYIYGASAGGRLAISFAERLTAASVSLRFVGITDAALFQDGSISDPRSLTDNLPEFRKVVIKADIKLNYFHTLGNGVTARLFGGSPLLWSSGMPFNEVHGEVVGFRNLDRDLTADVRAKTGVFSSDLTKHIECNKIALAKLRAKIIADLNNVP